MFTGVFLHGGYKLRPELCVHMTGCIDAKTINTVFPYPVLVDVDHAADNVRVLGECIVATVEITKIKGLAFLHDFAAIKVI